MPALVAMGKSKLCFVFFFFLNSALSYVNSRTLQKQNPAMLHSNIWVLTVK